MKKILLTVMAAILLAFAGGCTSKPETDFIKDEAEITTESGVLTVQDSTNSRMGTHLITKTDGSVIPARSLSVNLSNKRYLENKVEASGVLNTEDNVFEITGISVLEIILKDDSEAGTEEDTTDSIDSEISIDGSVDELKTDEASADESETPPALDAELTSFESLPYSFRGAYPKSWYYAGSLSSTTGVLHHYGFSTEPIEESNEIISLEVIDASLMVSSGSKMSVSGHQLIVVSSGATYTVYTTVDDRSYKISGPVEYKDLIVNMASSIEHIETQI